MAHTKLTLVPMLVQTDALGEALLQVVAQYHREWRLPTQVCRNKVGTRLLFPLRLLLLLMLQLLRLLQQQQQQCNNLLPDKVGGHVPNLSSNMGTGLRLLFLLRFRWLVPRR